MSERAHALPLTKTLTTHFIINLYLTHKLQVQASCATSYKPCLTHVSLQIGCTLHMSIVQAVHTHALSDTCKLADRLFSTTELQLVVHMHTDLKCLTCVS